MQIGRWTNVPNDKCESIKYFEIKANERIKNCINLIECSIAGLTCWIYVKNVRMIITYYIVYFYTLLFIFNPQLLSVSEDIWDGNSIIMLKKLHFSFLINKFITLLHHDFFLLYSALSLFYISLFYILCNWIFVI